jgi:hypothetical protein
MKVVGLRSAASANSISGQKNGRIFGEKQGIALKSHLCQDTDDFVDQHGS